MACREARGTGRMIAMLVRQGDADERAWLDTRQLKAPLDLAG